MTDPRTSCPFCGTPGRYVTADEGTSYFDPAPRPAVALDVDRLHEAMRRVLHGTYGTQWAEDERVEVAAIAREYAALQSTPEDPQALSESESSQRARADLQSTPETDR